MDRPVEVLAQVLVNAETGKVGTKPYSSPVFVLATPIDFAQLLSIAQLGQRTEALVGISAEGP